MEPAQPKQQNVVQEATAATTEAHELLKKEIAAATADEPVRAEATGQQTEAIPQSSVSGKTEVVVPKVKEQLRQKANASNEGMTDLNAASETTAGSEQEKVPVEVKRMVIPAWSAAQLAEAAKKQGDAPDIVRDDVTKVTLFDYSDIIADENPLQPEE